MATQNSYLKYKRDTRHLLYWMIHASNKIIRSATTNDDVPSNLKTVNTTGQTTVSGLVDMSKLIAKHISPVPSVIYSLFQSVIDARTAAYAIFQQIAARGDADPELERSNASHKHFIDALAEAFVTLGGEAWKKSGQKAGDANQEESSIEQVMLSNKFAALNLGTESRDGETAAADAGDSSENEAPNTEAQTGPAKAPQRRQPKSGKGKKGKGGKGVKQKKQQQRTPPAASLDDVPLESYRIIEDGANGGGLVTDYLMAVYDLVALWTRLRGYVQSLWREVAYDDLNSAVAGAVSNVAISMIKKAASAMFVDYPGHDSYETVMKTITRGNPDKAQGMFSVALYSISPDKTRTEKVRETHVDVREQVMIHAYNDLRDFILDFQKTHSGKPTKRMLAELGNWDPKFNLQDASDEGRIQWRRSYTINWLYDLVNVFSSIVVQRNTMKGEKHDLSKVDWSVTGPWKTHCRLFGLNEFAGWVTTLAFQKPGTVDIGAKILPHHVFGLQCIVDSLTVSRGWSLSGLRGHMLAPPPRDFRPRRDVDLFLDRENKEFGRGYLQPVDILKQLFEKDDLLHGDFDRHRDDRIMLEGFQSDFVNWLGESKYKFGLATIPPSRFSNSNANGLWEYSPFLCGVGLLDALELAYSSTLLLWDRIPEAVMLMHLHNMLVQKGHIQQSVGLYASLLAFFPGAFFADGKIPTSDFGKALVARLSGRETSPRAWNQRRRQAAPAAATTHGILDTKRNMFFNVGKPCPVLLREADWDPERIPDADVPVHTLLAALRLKQTKIVTDHKTGEKRLEETELVRRTKSKLGADDETLLQTASSLPGLGGGVDKMQAVPGFLRDGVPEGFRARWARETGKHRPNGTRQEEVPHKDLLQLIKWDVYKDICGDSPILSLNMVWVTVKFFMLFMKIELALEEAANDLWLRAYKMDKKWAKQKRVGLTYMALRGADGAGESDPDDVEECLEIMAEQFQDPRTGFMNHTYWKDLEEMSKRMERMGRRASSRQKQHHPADDACTVM